MKYIFPILIHFILESKRLIATPATKKLLGQPYQLDLDKGQDK